MFNFGDSNEKLYLQVIEALSDPRIFNHFKNIEKEIPNIIAIINEDDYLG